MNLPKKAVAIHDISGFGKCSLTVALPVLSAAGVETSVIPTAVLSTHTGGIEGFTYRDLTEDLTAFADHWQSLGLTFDALYSGFLGSFRQLEIVSRIFDRFKPENGIILVDPVMADHGKLYSVFPPDFPEGMRKLCAKADIIVPNITEALLLTDKPYEEGPYSEKFIENLLEDLTSLGAKKIVLTGVFFDEEHLGAATYENKRADYVLSKRIPGAYHGTGDVFGSALLGGLLNDFSLTESTRIAVDFTTASIRRTYEAQTDHRFGVLFEQEIPRFVQNLKLLDV
ncbi:MAG: pyridoxamine kinase [Dysgonamonadaceae bacterium]|jgi:pyridoxine kinase|nr:pyridoxamine kinase [Dysgonamonadaceae bacterium]